MPLAPPDRDSLSPKWARAFEWVEAHLGRVVGAQAQARWRPCYYLDVERHGEIHPLYFRGDREPDHGVYPLEHEMRVLQLLEAHGLPVPHVHGFCPEPRGIVMERCPGRANLSTAESDEEREQVLDDYVEFLAKMHALPLASLGSLGLAVPSDPETLALGDFAHWERQYRHLKRRPEPLIEFAIRWIRANVPRGRERVALLHADAGQFVFERGHMTAVLDFELACLGDPAADFAGLLCRDLSEPLGDLRRAVATYERATGVSQDLAAIYYHAVRFGIGTPMMGTAFMADPPREVNWPQYAGWYLVYGRVPLELIAHVEGIELDPPELPEAEPTRHEAAARWLAAALEHTRDRSSDETLRYEIDTALRTAQYFERVERYGMALEEENLEDARKLLGQRPATWQEAEAALEALVLEAPAGRNPEIVRTLHRRALRHESLLAPAMRELEGARAQLLD